MISLLYDFLIKLFLNCDFVIKQFFNWFLDYIISMKLIKAEKIKLFIFNNV